MDYIYRLCWKYEISWNGFIQLCSLVFVWSSKNETNIL